MLPLGMLLGMGSYGLVTWGYILVKGYNITLRSWFSPIHPHTGALDSNGQVPKGSIFPTSGKGTSGGGTSGTLSPQQQAGRQALKTKDRPPVQ